VEQLQSSLPKLQHDTSEQNSISVYSGELTPENWIIQIKKLSDAFPQITGNFYNVLAERLKEKGFSDERLNDAINNLIDNFTYPVPTIANIVSWDLRVKLYTYQQIVEMVNSFGSNIFNQYKRLSSGKYAHIDDINKFNIK
jgi:hypothetical protein